MWALRTMLLFFGPTRVCSWLGAQIPQGNWQFWGTYPIPLQSIGNVRHAISNLNPILYVAAAMWPFTVSTAEACNCALCLVAHRSSGGDVTE